MTTITQTTVAWQDGDVYRAVMLGSDGVALRQTRNDEHAAEGKYVEIVAAIPLREAVAMAKAILAAVNDEAQRDAELDEWVDQWLAECEDERIEQDSLRYGW